jgi:hypothetical protein
MRKLFTILATLSVLLGMAGPVSAATGSIGIANIAACKDTTTVTVSGSSSYASNQVRVSVYRGDSQGKYHFLAETTTPTFGSGNFGLPVTVDYSANSVAEGATLRIEVRLRAGGSTVSGPIITYVTAADKHCVGKCSVVITSTDRAPAAGVVTLRSHFGSWFRPEGRLHGVVPVAAGQILNTVIVGVSCEATLRAWYYPATGKDRTPKLLPSQYWPNEYGTNQTQGLMSYSTSFKQGLPATRPLETDDPYAPK